MIFNEKEITLKNNRKAIFRTQSATDADRLLDYIKTASGETDFLLRYPEEYESMSIEQEEQWIDSARYSPNVLMITCFIDGKVSGNCQINFKSGIKTRHIASVAIAVLRDYWNLGIGSAMFEELITAAIGRGVEIMELEFIEGNDRARHLYEKFGFRVVSEKPNAFKLKDGTMLKEFYMQKYLLD